MEKATHEAKQRTGWIDVNESFDTSIERLRGRCPGRSRTGRGHRGRSSSTRLLVPGRVNALAQKVIQLDHAGRARRLPGHRVLGPVTGRPRQPAPGGLLAAGPAAVVAGARSLSRRSVRGRRRATTAPPSCSSSIGRWTCAVAGPSCSVPAGAYAPSARGRVHWPGTWSRSSRRRRGHHRAAADRTDGRRGRLGRHRAAAAGRPLDRPADRRRRSTAASSGWPTCWSGSRWRCWSASPAEPELKRRGRTATDGLIRAGVRDTGVCILDL